MGLKIDSYNLIPQLFMNALNSQDLAYIKSKAQTIFCKPGEIIFCEGDEAKGVYFIKRGFVNTYRLISKTAAPVIASYRRGDYFGYYPLFFDDPHPVTARAESQVILSFTGEEYFVEVLHRTPDLAQVILSEFAKECGSIMKLSLTSTYRNN